MTLTLILATNLITAFVVWSCMRWYANRLPATIEALAYQEKLERLVKEDEEWMIEAEKKISSATTVGPDLPK